MFVKKLFWNFIRGSFRKMSEEQQANRVLRSSDGIKKNGKASKAKKRPVPGDDQPPPGGRCNDLVDLDAREATPEEGVLKKEKEHKKKYPDGKDEKKWVDSDDEVIGHKFDDKDSEASRSKKRLSTTEKLDLREAALEEEVLGFSENVVENVIKINEEREKTRKKRKKKDPCENENKKWVDSDDEHGLEFETITPSWAEKFVDEDSEAESDEEALKTHSHYNAVTQSVSLPATILDYKRVCDGNKDEPTQKGTSLYNVEFHPKATVLVTGGLDRTLRLFAVDGSKNKKIHSVFIDKHPILCCHFSRGGSEIVIGSMYKSFYTYDLEGSSGITLTPKVKGLEMLNTRSFVVSPDGRFLAFLGSYGHIHLFSQKSHEWIDTLKQNEDVLSVCFSNDGHYMYSFGLEGLVYIWDMSTRDCVHRFRDQGCVNGSSVGVSPDGNYLVCGSKSGLVNVYHRDTTITSHNPEPVKLIKNLVTQCDQLLFNCSSEILAMRSDAVKKAVKLVHTPSMTILNNFPDQIDHDLKHCKTMDFSPSSGYLALGTDRGKCLLYRLKHYTKY